MRKFILLAVFCIVGVSCYVPESEYNEKFQNLAKEAHKICVEESGVSQAEIDKVKQGKFDDDIKIKEYNNCLWKNTKVMGDNFELNMDLLKEVLPEKVREAQIEALSHCIKEIKAAPADLPIVEKTFLLSKCVYNRNPGTWMYF